MSTRSSSVWRTLTVIALLTLGLIYALPSVFGEDLAVQISPLTTHVLDASFDTQIKGILASGHIAYTRMQHQKTRDAESVLVRFPDDPDLQLKARDLLKQSLGEHYTVALNLAPRTPGWLQALGAHPIKLGLDLRGGVHFLLNVDVNAVLKLREAGDLLNMRSEMRDKNIRYTMIVPQKPNGLQISFRDGEQRDAAKTLFASRFPQYIFTKAATTPNALAATMTHAELTKIANYAIDQTMTVLRKRVNELGVSEAIVQRQGQDHISVDLPGIQDTARAKNLIGKTATLRFQLVDADHDAQAAVAGNVPVGSTLYQYEGHPVLLKNRVILKGSSITYATAMFRNARAAVSIKLGGGGESFFHRTTAEKVGQSLAVVYVETKSQHHDVAGKTITTQKQVERVISVATIQSALGNDFEITGLQSIKYARNLALLLRSGALEAPVLIVQELTVGPSLGQSNIDKGMRSLEVGGLLVVLFMLLYYRLFGLIANTALLLNIIFIIALLSILGATLTLPGIAGIVLTVGMAVDANVLINERIREELRNGMSALASIQAGYDRAFSTIVDSNVTTLIVALVLYTLGSGPVKGFAVTIIIGLLTSMFTAIFYTRVVVQWIYARRKVKKLMIGI